MIYEAANDTFQQLIPYADFEGVRAAGHAVLGASSYLVHFPGATEVRRYLRRHVARLEVTCKRPDWIAAWNGPDWPVAAQALLIAGDKLGRDNLGELGRGLLGELLDRTSHGTLFLRTGENPDEEEIPVTASTFIEALGAAFKLGRDRDLLEPIRAAADWFLGANRLGKALYDFKTAGCHDALSASGLNPNQGLESSAYWLLALLTLQELAGSMSSIPPPPPAL